MSSIPDELLRVLKACIAEHFDLGLIINPKGTQNSIRSP